jgi:zinc protease
LSIVIPEPLPLPSAGTLARSTVHSGSLENGIRWAVWSDPRDTVVTIQAWVKVGSAWESPGATGMAHMLEHLMFRGTHAVPDGEFDGRMERLGASINAATWLDYTMYMCTVAPGGVEEAMELEADRLANLNITHEVFQTERDVVANERRQVVESDPDSVLHELFYQLTMESAPYSWPTIGWAADIAGYTAEGIRGFYRNHYVSECTAVVLCGNLSPEEAQRLVAKYFGGLSRRPAPAGPAPTRFSDSWKKSVPIATTTPRFVTGWPGPSARDADFPAWCMFYEVVGGGDASRIPLELEVRRELVNDVQVSLAQHRDACVFDIRATLLPDVEADEVREVILSTLQRLADEGPTSDELEAAQIRIRTADALALASTSSRAEWMGESWIVHDDFIAGFELADQIVSVTAAQVAEIARRLLSSTRWELTGEPNGAVGENE